ncbi:methylmalonyl-CoA mutase subunit beta [Aestuariivivens sediminicola]|uniref:methylmalonyl-CoA mutase subunit beta n=1 Tax=Aestuariivivens sediminicola TaxID=2913560 RepID=UPI001F59AB7A|nr:methylmalonyl-CoA mutase subunit beta [Aestuariivivens sediminicola]
MSKTLFDDFHEVSAKEWKQKIQYDLKGADYNKTLIWNSNEDIAVKPFYHADDFNELPLASGTRASQWDICEPLFVQHAEKANLKAQNALKRGAESVKFVIPSDAISVDALLRNVSLEDINLHFELQFLSPDFIKRLLEARKRSTGSMALIPGFYFDTDIIGHLASSGNWYTNIHEDFEQFSEIFKSIHSITVNASVYQNAGATMVQQLAYCLAHANEYLNFIDSEHDFSKITASKQPVNMMFKVAVGSNYFFEIAKLRALKMLWRTLAKAYNITPDCHIFVTPTKRNKTLYDYNSNMLRTTTECMSAILGGANTICNMPYDAIFHRSNDFGERIARNQLLILKHESFFKMVNNPCDGAYYIESLTQQLATKALELFKDIELHGGFLKQLKEGTIQRKIKESAKKEQQNFNDGEDLLIGSNAYPNSNDKMKHELEIYPFVKVKPRKTLIEPIIEHRLSEKLEQERLKKES